MKNMTFLDLRTQQNGGGGGDRWQEDAGRRLTSRTMRVPPPANGKNMAWVVRVAFGPALYNCTNLYWQYFLSKCPGTAMFFWKTFFRLTFFWHQGGLMGGGGVGGLAPLVRPSRTRYRYPGYVNLGLYYLQNVHCKNVYLLKCPPKNVCRKNMAVPVTLL